MKRLISFVRAIFGTLALLCFAAALPAGEPIGGTVVDQSGAPLPGTKVEAFSDQGSLLGVAVTDEKGAYALVDLPLQRCLLRFTAPNFAVRQLSAAAGESLRVALSLAPITAEVTVTASRGFVEDTQTSDRVVVVRDGLDFHTRPTVHVGDALQGTPGVMLQETTFGQVSPHLRGLTGYQTLLLLDGIRYNVSTFRSGPNQYLGYIMPSQADRVEAALGPAGANYGSDALGGALNVLTAEPHFGSARKMELHGNFSSLGSSADLAGRSNGTVSVGNSRFSLLLGGGWQKENDLYAGGGEDSRNAFRRFFGLDSAQIRNLLGDRLRYTAFQQHGFNSKLAWRPAAGQSLTAWFQQTGIDGERSYRDQLGGSARIVSDAAPQGLRFAYLRYEKTRVWRLDSVSGTFSVNSQLDGAARGSYKYSDTVTQDRSRTNSYGYSLQGATRSGPHFAQVFGAEIYDDHVFSTRFLRNLVAGTATQDRAQYPNDSRYRTAGLFIQNSAELFGGRLRASFGARFTDIAFQAWASRNVDLTGKSLGVADTRRNFRDVTFNSALTFKVTSDLALGALVGRGFRAPNMNDLGGAGLTTLGYDIPVEDLLPYKPLLGADNSDTAISAGRQARALGPESLMNHEASVRYRRGNFHARLQVFDAEMSDPISGRTILFPISQVPAAIGGVAVTPIAQSAAQKAQGVVAVATGFSPRAVKTSVNDGRSKYYGTESVLGWAISQRLSVETNYSFLVGRDLDPNRPARRLPPQQGSVSVRWLPRAAKLWVQAQARFSGAQGRLNGGDVDDDRIGASRRRSDIKDFFNGDFVKPYLQGGVFTPTNETLAQIQDRVLPVGATVNGVLISGDGIRVPLYTRTDGWWCFDLRAGKRLTERLDGHVGIGNVLNRNYRVHGSGIDAPGRNLFAGFSYAF